MHPWDEPVKRVLAKAIELNVHVKTPKIGEPLIINSQFIGENWWETNTLKG